MMMTVQGNGRTCFTGKMGRVGDRVVGYGVFDVYMNKRWDMVGGDERMHLRAMRIILLEYIICTYYLFKTT